MGRIASSKAASPLISRMITPADRLMLRLTGSTVSALLAGLPVIWVTTTGARSNRPRTVPLTAVPHGEGIAVIGTQFGRVSTPGWVYNLRANPAATVAWRDATVAVTARPLGQEEALPVWQAAADIYPGYARYRERASHRKIEVFSLERD